MPMQRVEVGTGANGDQTQAARAAAMALPAALRELGAKAEAGDNKVPDTRRHRAIGAGRLPGGRRDTPGRGESGGGEGGGRDVRGRAVGELRA